MRLNVNLQDQDEVSTTTIKSVNSVRKKTTTPEAASHAVDTPPMPSTDCGIVEDLAGFGPRVEAEAGSEPLAGMEPQRREVSVLYLRADQRETLRFAGKPVMVRQSVHWTSMGGSKRPVRCNSVGPASCAICLAGTSAPLTWAHLAVYVIGLRDIRILQMPYDTAPGALLPQLAREAADPEASRLLFDVTRSRAGSRYEVCRLNALAPATGMGEREITDFLARGGLRPADVRDLYAGYSNADMLRFWPELGDLITIHHPEIDISGL